MRTSGGVQYDWVAAVSEAWWRRLMRMGGGSDENTHIVGVARHKCDLIAWRHQFVRVTKLAYAVRRPRSAIGKYAFQLSAML